MIKMGIGLDITISIIAVIGIITIIYDTSLDPLTRILSTIILLVIIAIFSLRNISFYKGNDEI